MTRKFNLDDQIASTPGVVGDLLDTTSAPRLDPERPIIFTGIGTSLHASRVAAEWITRLSGGNVRPLALDAHDVGTTAPLTARDQVVVISHRGTKIFPTASLTRAREAGATTIAIVGKGAPEQPADHTLVTCANESAGTFSISYLASMAVLAKLAAPFDRDGAFGFEAGLRALPDAISQTIESSGAIAAAAKVAEVSPLLLVGFGLDLPTVQEAALKIKEGAWMWTEAMSPEFALHGTPASFHSDMGVVLVEPEPTDSDGGRTSTLRRALGDLSIEVVLSCGERDECDLPFVASHPLLRPVTAIIPFQQLTAELARLRDSDPDTMHGDRQPWKSVMDGLTL
jgi:glucosamine--fructose-6-phosphate aminotransferase (isomerizing)